MAGAYGPPHVQPSLAQVDRRYLGELEAAELHCKTRQPIQLARLVLFQDVLMVAVRPMDAADAAYTFECIAGLPTVLLLNVPGARPCSRGQRQDAAATATDVSLFLGFGGPHRSAAAHVSAVDRLHRALL